VTPAQRRALQRLERQARTLEPALVAAILRAIGLVRERLPVGEVERLIRQGRIAEAVDAAAPAELLERALNPASTILRDGVVRAGRGAPLPPSAKDVLIAFNDLNPRVLDAVRALDTTSIRTLVPETRQALREAIEAGLADGVNPRQVARGLREIVGLAPNQAEAVRNYRRALESGDFAKVRGYGLRDRRFDRALKAGDLSAAQVDRMVAAYERRMRSFAATTHARTAAIESQKLGQQLAWREAQEAGAFDGAEVVRVWVTTLDGRERDEHRAMHGATAPLGQPYRNGQMYPGEGEYNCRCTEVIRVVPRRDFALAA